MMRALIIEQDAWVVLLIEDALRELGYTAFDVAVGLDDAIRAAQRQCPDLITSDIRLGSENGLDAVQAICSDGAVPVVFVTATGWEARERDTNAVVVQKPFQPADLKNAVVTAQAAACLAK